MHGTDIRAAMRCRRCQDKAECPKLQREKGITEIVNAEMSRRTGEAAQLRKGQAVDRG